MLISRRWLTTGCRPDPEKVFKDALSSLLDAVFHWMLDSVGLEDPDGQMQIRSGESSAPRESDAVQRLRVRHHPRAPGVAPPPPGENRWLGASGFMAKFMFGGKQIASNFWEIFFGKYKVCIKIMVLCRGTKNFRRDVVEFSSGNPVRVRVSSGGRPVVP